MPFLVLDNNGKSESSKRVTIDSELTVIGRHPECQVIVEDSAVSRKHAQIVQRDGNYFVEDLDSRNGTHLNEKAVHEPTRLFNGDLIQICDTRFTFLTDEPGAGPVRTTRRSSKPDDISSISLEDDENGMSSIMSMIDVPSHHSRVMVSAETKLTALMEITRALASSVKRDEVLAKTLDCLFELFVNADRGFVIIEDADGRIVPVAMKIRNPNDDEKIRISRTIVKHVMSNKQALISSDAATDDRFDLSQSLSDFRIRSIMCAPLLDSEQQPLGVIQLDTLRRGISFKDEDLDLLTTVAIQTGLAVENLTRHEEAIRQRELQRDLELANEVQLRLLPTKRPEIEGYSFSDYYRPANHVGGDYYDYRGLDGQPKTAVIVADVVGHGIAAALLVAKLSVEVRSALAENQSPSQAMQSLNAAIEHLNLDRFITMVLGVLDHQTHTFTVVNAGHMQPIVRRASGQIFHPDERCKDVPVGILDSASFPEYEIELELGDCVLIYTDGVNESMNRDGQQFGIPRMVEAYKSSPADPQQIISNVMTDVRNFVGNENQFDDICIVCFSRQP